MTEQEAATRKLFKAQTVHLGPCPRCGGERLLTTDYGLKHCECIWRPRSASAAPRLIRGVDTVWDARMLGADPWPVTVDRRDTGNFDMWRHMAWRSLAHQRWLAYVQNRPDTFHADALFTYDVQEVAFQRHETYASIRALLQLPLLILFEGIDPPFMHDTIQQLLLSIVPARRAAGLGTWVFRLEPSASILRSPCLPQEVDIQPGYHLDTGVATTPPALTAGTSPVGTITAAPPPKSSKKHGRRQEDPREDTSLSAKRLDERAASYSPATRNALK